MGPPRNELCRQTQLIRWGLTGKTDGQITCSSTTENNLQQLKCVRKWPFKRIWSEKVSWSPRTTLTYLTRTLLTRSTLKLPFKRWKISSNTHQTLSYTQHLESRNTMKSHHSYCRSLKECKTTLTIETSERHKTQGSWFRTWWGIQSELGKTLWLLGINMPTRLWTSVLWAWMTS